MSYDDPILVTRPTPATALITLNRPERRNAMSLAMWQQLADLFDGFAADEPLRSVVLTGAGGAFSAGADIKEFAQVRGTPDAAKHYAHAVDRCTLSIARCPKATFAAISGPAFGGGCGLALACDFRIADGTARFAIPAARLGIVYGIEETRALLLTVGYTEAKRMLFSAKPLSADDALSTGLVTELVAEPALHGALERAHELAASAPLSIAGAKCVLEALTAGESPDRVAAVDAIVDRAMGSADYAEGRLAFAERRDPRFTGR